MLPPLPEDWEPAGRCPWEYEEEEPVVSLGEEEALVPRQGILGRPVTPRAALKATLTTSLPESVKALSPSGNPAMRLRACSPPDKTVTTRTPKVRSGRC